MSLIIAGNFERYILIAADTRASGINNNWFKDNDHKIFSCPCGLVTGSGLVEILDPFKKIISEIEILNTDQINHIIQKVIIPKTIYLKNRVPNQFAFTTFVFAYRSIEKNNPILRLIFIPEDRNYEFISFTNPTIIYPSDINIKNQQIITSKFNNLLDQSTKQLESSRLEMQDIYNNFILNSQIFNEIFGDISRLSALVSNNYDIALYTRDGLKFYCYQSDFNNNNFPYKEITNYSGLITTDILL